MANWWGNMTGAQAVQMGMNLFNMAQQQTQQQQELQRQQQQQQMENLFTKMQLNIRKEAQNLEAEKLRFGQQELQAERERRAKELAFEEQRWQEQLGFKREELAQEAKLVRERMKVEAKGKEKPDLGKYPSSIKQAMDLYEQTGNWGIVQAVQKQYGMPIDKTPGNITEMKEATNVWKFAEQQGLPLTVDRKFGRGGEEMALPHEVVERYGAETIQALQRIGGILGTDKYRQYTIPQLYEIYFRAKRFRAGGRTQKEIVNKMKEAGYPDDLISDLIKAL